MVNIEDGCDLFFKGKARRVEHNMPKVGSFGAKQFKTSRFSLKQGIKSNPYCRTARVLTQFQRKDTVLNHIGFDSPRLNQSAPTAMCEVSVFGNAPRGACEKLTGEICKILEVQAAVPPERTYVKFSFIDTWGYNGYLF